MASQPMEETRSAARGKAPKGFYAVGVFLFFGATMAGLAGTTLIWRDTFLQSMWTLNPRAYAQLAPLGKMVGVLFLGLSVALATAGAGWLLWRIWGWWLAVGIIVTQVVGDLVNAVRGEFVRGAVGATIAGALLFYLWRPQIREAFAARQKSNRPI